MHFIGRKQELEALEVAFRGAAHSRLSKSAKSTARLLTFIRSELPRISP